MSNNREPWSPEEEAILRDRPYDYQYFESRFPGKRTRKAFQIKREMLGISRNGVFSHTERVDQGGDTNNPIFWNKQTSEASWDDFIAPLAQFQALRSKTTKSQDYASIVIPTDVDVPVAFVSDWHIGSWGADALDIGAATEKLLKLHRERGLYIAVLGDMIEMAIRMRGVIEMAGNLMPPGMQLDFLKLWVERMAPLILWSTWDNHAVAREEDLTGSSMYAEIFKDKTIYHSGIGHTDLTCGDETYTLVTSHRFRGRSRSNPLASQMQYLHSEAPDREIAIAGDSHLPAMMQYVHGGMVKTVANCGTLQSNSGYSKRFFSLHSSNAMPVLVFGHDEHIVRPYYSIEHYERSLQLDNK